MSDDYRKDDINLCIVKSHEDAKKCLSNGIATTTPSDSGDQYDDNTEPEEFKFEYRLGIFGACQNSDGVFGHNKLDDKMIIDIDRNNIKYLDCFDISQIDLHAIKYKNLFGNIKRISNSRFDKVKFPYNILTEIEFENVEISNSNSPNGISFYENIYDLRIDNIQTPYLIFYSSTSKKHRKVSLKNLNDLSIAFYDNGENNNFLNTYGNIEIKNSNKLKMVFETRFKNLSITDSSIVDGEIKSEIYNFKVSNSIISN